MQVALDKLQGRERVAERVISWNSGTVTVDRSRLPGFIRAFDAAIRASGRCRRR